MKRYAPVHSMKTYILISIISIAVISAVACSYFMSERMVNKYAPLIDASMEVKLETTTAHLWLEELISGDRTGTIKPITEQIDRSLWYAEAMLAGGTNPEGTFLPLSDQILRDGIESVIKDLHLFKLLSIERYKGHAQSSTSIEMSQEYDNAFRVLIEQADHVETLLQQKSRSENKIYVAVQIALLIFIIASSCLMFSMQYKYALRHREDMGKLRKEIEERKSAEEKVLESNALKDEFIATASHELRSPLAVLSGYSELLLGNDSLSDEIRKDCLISIHSKASVMDRIIDELLDVSRVESGRLINLECAPIKISDVAQKVVQQFQNNQHSAIIETRFEDDQLELLADSVKMFQVFENLIGNAIKYSPDGAQVEVIGEKIGEQYQVTVADKGMGMSPEQQKHVFEKFYRADTSNTSIKGLGIGLYLVKHIIERHNGELWFESRLGEGSKFFFALPLNNVTVS